MWRNILCCDTVRVYYLWYVYRGVAWKMAEEEEEDTTRQFMFAGYTSRDSLLEREEIAHR